MAVGCYFTIPISIEFYVSIIILGVKNYVIVNCSDAKHFSCCNIMDLNNDGKSIPLLNTEHNILVCGPFKPNNNPFYIQVSKSIVFIFN